MRKIYLGIIAFCFTNNCGFAQMMCSGGQFYTQSDVDAFQDQFSSCDSIGVLDIMLNADELDPIHDLAAFSGLEYVGFLSISNQGNDPSTFVSLSPLANLTGVGEALFTTVHDFTGLENLVEVEGELAINFVNLHPDPLSLAPFDNLVSATTIRLDITDYVAPMLTNVFPSLSQLENLIIGDGTLNPEGMNVLHLSGFNAVQQLEYFAIGNTAGQPCYIGELDILNNVDTIGSFVIDWLSCDSFDGFQNLHNAGDMTFLIFNSSGGIMDFPVLETAGNMWFWVNQEVTSNYSFPLLQSCGYMHLFQDQGANSFNLSMPSITTIDGFFEYSNYSSQINEVAATLEFPQLEHITGNFTIQGISWSDLNVFSNLETIDGEVIIGANPQLSNCDIMALCQKVAVAPEDIELISNASGCNSIAELSIECQVSGISGTVYVDLNCNGEVDTNDPVFNNPIILGSDGQPIGESGTNGDYFIPFIANTTFELVPQSSVALAPTSPITIVTGDSEQVFMGNDFLLCPNSDFHDCSVSAFSIGSPRPGFNLVYNIIVRNNGYQTESATVVFDLSNMPGASFQDVGGGIVDGNNVSYVINEIAPQEEIVVELMINTSVSTPLSTIQIPLITLMSINDVVPENDVYTWPQTVVGSYDPNDINVDKSAIDFETFSPDNTWLHYTIRFQNTGTFPAEFVRVTDLIEDDLDLGTISVISTSHPYELSFADNQVEWFFDNIQLPDSMSDPEGSIGHIHYKIKIKSDVVLDDIIENFVAIYFDFNEPIITNTATTEFYICPEPISATGTTVICEGQVSSLLATDGYDTYNWNLNNQSVSTEQLFGLENLDAGNYILEYEGTTEYCASSGEIDIAIYPIPEVPTIIQNMNTLTASGAGTFVWTFNGEVLSDTDNSIDIDESGEYSVFVTINDCASDVTMGNFIHTGIESMTNEFDFIIYPNPVNDVLNITLIQSGKFNVSIFDSSGKPIQQFGFVGSKAALTFDAFCEGIYRMVLSNEKGEINLSKSFVVIR